ncbi:MAG: ribonuclease [Bacteroidota bacterium]|jgi:ribonuclease-3|nr:ribonuclease III [Bacteroidota bacterium]
MIRLWQRFKRATHAGPDTDISTLVRREFGLRVRQRKAYDEALTHSSMLDGDTSGLKSNERLEFLGDVVLDMTMAQYLYRQFPEAQEGELTKRKSRVVNRKNLNLLGKNMGLQHLIRAKMRRDEIHDTMVGNALEALIGAMYLDHGFQKTQRAVLLMLKHYGLDEQVHETRDFKSQLHHWASKRKKSLQFQVIQDDERAGDERYVVEVLINGKPHGRGVGPSKKEAEQEAARRAWKTVYERRESNVNPEKPSSDRSKESGSPRGTKPRRKSPRRPPRGSHSSDSKASS